MEVALEDRGRIPHDAYFQGKFLKWENSSSQLWWNRVFDACVSAEKKMIPGGDEILIVKDENNG